MAVLLVRHARAGSRKYWKGNDIERPLSKKGLHQAEGLVDMLARYPIKRIVSSPYVRCVQTVEPAAEKLKMKVEVLPELAEGAGPDEILPLLRRAAGSTIVWCTHGDIVPIVLDAIAEDGVKLKKADRRYAKGSFWELEQDKKGRVTKATYFPAPEAD
ncbi:MAG: histidine phosphatase family protein [Acidimicrobiia bacterium]|nr:histidine phosphatase family protein [Acidimicrobiia bacterium]